MKCKIPLGFESLAPNSVATVYVQSQSSKFRSHSTNLYFIKRAYLTKVSPSIADIRGGATITITGYHFLALEQDKLRCQFDFVQTVATFVNDKIITCITPNMEYFEVYQYSSQLKWFTMKLNVILDDYHVSNNSLTFYMYKHPTITAISPVRGYIDGNDLITITGVNFPFNLTDATSGDSLIIGVCRFGIDNTYYTTFTAVNSNEIQCKSPPAQHGGAGFVSVEISFNNGQDWTDSGILFEYMSIANIIDIKPAIGPITGGTNITIFTSNIRTNIQHYCQFNDNLNNTINTTTITDSETIISCLTPDWSNFTNMNVTGLLYQVVDFTIISPYYHLQSERFRFVYIKIMALNRISRDFLHSLVNNSDSDTTERNSQTITVIGNNFLNHDNLTCYINGTKAIQTIFQSSKVVQCQVLQTAFINYIGLISIHFNLGNFQQFSNKLYVNVTETPKLYSVTPSSGTFAGGTEILLHVSPIFNTSHLACAYDYVYTEREMAVYVNNSYIKCVTLPLEAALDSLNDNGGDGTLITKTISFTMNGIDWFDNATSVQFSWHPPIVISSINPPFGDVNGGTVITIYGSNFVNGIYCRFGNSTVYDLVLATFVSNSEVSCVTPARGSATIENVELSRTGGREFSNNDATFEWINPIVIESFYPKHGKINGGTFVVIFASNLRNSTLTMCRWNILEDTTNAATNVTTQVEYVYPNAVGCYTPNMTAYTTLTSYEQNVSISLSNNDQEFYKFNGYQFHYDAIISIDSIEPTVGPALGGTNLLINTTNLEHNQYDNNLTDLSCKFEYYTDGYGTTSLETYYFKATWLKNNVNKNQLNCETPRFVTSKNTHSGIVNVSIGINDQVFESYSETKQQFTFYDHPIIYSFDRDSGFYEWPNIVIVNGRNFIQTPTMIARLDNNDTYLIDHSGITFVDSTIIKIQTPNISIGTFANNRASIELSLNNGSDWTNWGVLYYFFERIVIDEIYPEYGNQNGGTKVTIRGLNFIDSSQLYCNFYNKTVLANYINNKHIMCVAPSCITYFPGFCGQWLYVQVTNNLQDYTGPETVKNRFWYHGNVNISYLTPKRGFLRGGTPVTIVRGELDTNGADWNISTHAYCKFGNKIVTAYNIYTHNITCTSPFQESTRNVTVSISINGIDFTDGTDHNGNNLLFYYQDYVTIDQATPPRGPVTGNTLVKIKGKNFESNTPIYCRFDDTSVHYVTGTVLNDTLISCEFTIKSQFRNIK